VQTVVENGGADGEFELRHQVRTWKGDQPVGDLPADKVSLRAGETKTVLHTIRLPGARLWSPEDPFLYVLHPARSGTTSPRGSACASSASTGRRDART